MIHFNNLPDSGSSNTLITGKHKVKVTKAEMKQPKDLNKPEYLNVTLAIYDDSNNQIGTIWDILSESDKALVQYKLKRFILGFNIPITGDFELRDLAKVVVGREAYAELTIQTSDTYPDKTVVDATKNEIYTPIEEDTGDAMAELEQAYSELPSNLVGNSVEPEEQEMF